MGNGKFSILCKIAFLLDSEQRGPLKHRVKKQDFRVPYTLSGRIGKVVASRAAVARLVPAEVALIYSMHGALREYCP